jgi:hypothetical protein
MMSRKTHKEVIKLNKKQDITKDLVFPEKRNRHFSCKKN